MTDGPTSVFISYQRADVAVAEQIRAHLEAHGVTTWMDRYDIPHGAYWPDEIDAGLAASAVVVGILSPAATASRNVKNEWDWAIRNGRRLVLVRVSPTEIPHRYVALNFIDYLADADTALAALLRAVGARARPDAPATAPPPSTPAPDPALSRVSTLPPVLTPLVGRDRELEEVVELLRDGTRLVTLTGPGGTGKTRLALEAARTLEPHFPDGAGFVPLASTPPEAFLSAVATALGLQESGGESLLDVVLAALRERGQLLVLDNFEHLLSAAPLVAQLLTGAPGLSLLVTSRARLRLHGEQDYPVRPLALPNLRGPVDPDTLLQCGAISLFCQRATSARRDFRLTAQNATAVAEICCRLDGLPLALELAAARSRMLAPQAMLARMERRLPLLTGGARDLPARQQTLRDAIAWSYELLTEDERKLYRRLSVFRGGWTLEAAEAVAGTPESGEVGIDVFTGLEQLVDHSLVREVEQPDGELRFGMLETIREYGLDELETSGEADEAHERHATFYAELAEQALPELDRAEQAAWLERLETEHDNFRAALDWSSEHDGGLALRIAAYIWRFWLRRGHLAEGLRWLTAVLQHVADAPVVLHAQVLQGLGAIAWAQGDYHRAAPLLGQSVELLRGEEPSHQLIMALNSHGVALTALGEYERAARVLDEGSALGRAAGDDIGLATNLTNLAVVFYHQGNLDEAMRLLDASLVAYRRLSDTHSIAINLHNLGAIAFQRGDLERSALHLTESETLFRELGDARNTATTIGSLGLVDCARGDFITARALFEESLALHRELGDQQGMGVVLSGIAFVDRKEGHGDSSVTRYGEAAVLLQESGDRRSLAECLVGLAGAVLDQGDPARSAWLFGASDALLEAIEASLDDFTRRAIYDVDLPRLVATLGDAEFKRAYALGHATPQDQAVAVALGAPVPDSALAGDTG